MALPLVALLVAFMIGATALHLIAARRAYRAAEMCKVRHTVALIAETGDGDHYVADRQVISALPQTDPAITFTNRSPVSIQIVGIDYAWSWPAVQLHGEGTFGRDHLLPPGEKFLVRLNTEVHEDE
jgi:hypothetical protein